MIKNVIIAGLTIALVTGVSSEEALEYSQIGLDYLQELIYYVKESS